MARPFACTSMKTEDADLLDSTTKPPEESVNPAGNAEDVADGRKRGRRLRAP